MRWGGSGAWRRRLRRHPALTVMTDDEMQRVVLAAILREYPVLLTFPALACELFENPNDPSRSALHVRRLSGGDGWAAWR